VLVTDDEVIDQWQVEHVDGGAQSQREPRTSGLGVGVTRMGNSARR
jgi:hypothetical protein